MKSSNLILNGKAANEAETVELMNKVSRIGVLSKILFGLFIMVSVFMVMFFYPPLYNFVAVLYLPLSIMMIIGYIILLIAASKNVKFAKIAFFFYVVLEGALLSVISIALELYYPGIVSNAVLMTLAITTATVILYSLNPGIVTNRFIGIVTAVLGGIFIIYILNFFLRIFGISLVAYNSNISIGFTVFVLLFGALLLMVDLKRVDQMIKNEVPKEYEWLLALGILTTIVWIYVESLKLISKLRSRN